MLLSDDHRAVQDAMRSCTKVRTASCTARWSSDNNIVHPLAANPASVVRPWRPSNRVVFRRPLSSACQFNWRAGRA